MMQNNPLEKSVIIKYIVKNSVFLLFWSFIMQMKMRFMVLEIWLFGFEKILENF